MSHHYHPGYKSSLLRLALMLITSLSLLLPGSAFANARQDFDKGMLYFKQAQYDKAIRAFEQAQKKGLKKPALYYNLGVSHFKTKRYDKAKTYFKQTLKYKNMKSLAEYNLGLVALKKNNRKEAKQWFKKSRTSSNKKIATLSERQLEKLSPKKRSRATKKWYSYASFSYGYNTNIKLVPVEVATNTSNSFMDLYASTSGILSGTYTDGYSLDGFAYLLDYADINSYDETQARLGLYKSKKYAAWQTRIGGYYEHSTFGKDPYQRVIGVEARAKRGLQKTNKLSLRYRYNDIKSLFRAYDYLQGWRQQFRTEYLDYTASDSTRLYYELELNDRQNLVRANGEQRNYSPTRHKFQAVYRYNLTKAWRIGGEFSYRFSKYQPTPTQNRQDDRYRAALEARYKINRQWRVTGRYQRTDNSSTESIYSYTQNLYYVSVGASF